MNHKCQKPLHITCRSLSFTLSTWNYRFYKGCCKSWTRWLNEHDKLVFTVSKSHRTIVTMNHSRVLQTLAFLTLFHLPAPLSRASAADDKSYDVVIYGGTAAGIAAAVQVKRMGGSVVVIEPGRRNRGPDHGRTRTD